MPGITELLSLSPVDRANALKLLDLDDIEMLGMAICSLEASQRALLHFCFNLELINRLRAAQGVPIV